MTRNNLFNRARLAFLGAMVLCAFLSTSAQAARFGTACQESFENNWQTKGTHVWERCSGFNNELDDTDTKVFYYNLHNADWWWHTDGDQGTLDNVSLFYANTHGGITTTGNNSFWTMWDEDMNVWSSSMRLGDESYGTSIFSTYACNTLKFDDGKLWTRMGSIFRGGLRYATGSHDKVYGGYTTDEVGEDYADNLQKGRTIRYAWKDANSDWATNQDLAVMATGASATDCASRRDNMKWQNFGSYPRLRDGQAAWSCYTYWNNL